MNVFAKRALIAGVISIIWTLLTNPYALSGGFAYFLGACVGSFILVYLVLIIVGLFIKPKKPVVSEPKSKEDDLFE
jgi:membrane protease YdiL (CAAX protease family)